MSQTTTSGRLLTLLSLLQTPREWPGPELAERLGVSQRTIRNDVERLRGLGYPVHASRGSVGGYRLAAGAAMPPLLLEDDEAVAVAVSLATTSGSGMDGIQETSLRALTKLMQVLPKRLAGRVDALAAHTVRVGPKRGGSDVDGQLLALLAGTARDREVLRFGYADHAGAGTERRVEPYRLVSMGRRWYLVAFDVERDDWRTFRVDRMSEARSVGHRFRLRELPAEDIADYVARKTRQVQMKVTGRVVVHLPAERVEQRFGWWAEGAVEPLAEDRCRVTIGGRTPADVASWLGVLDADFEVEDSPELARAVRAVADRYGRAVPEDLS
ncbi:YafY family transcriptional regulator [Nocardioides mangrovicus]|uniref:YafY family transcriptional regulator n=1 Tax=Nocardioides mangrovicus TaxID=2478913 RepID=A0A3L8P427_9ACTN|nr:YafY family protein [Nocardioides mangrovicus]RLV49814.1 YafY family transcriptional regulator [Nocardioides mangrovicus]